MSKHIKKFETQAAYQAALPNLERPNVSLIEEGRVIGYNPYTPVPPTPVETKIVLQYDVDTTSEPFNFFMEYTQLSAITYFEIDGVEQSEALESYVFSTTGIHTVKLSFRSDEDIYFQDCTFVSASIPNNVSNLYGTFNGCNQLTSVTLPDSLVTISDSADYGCFSNNTALSSITIPSSVTTFGNYVFHYCESLSSITYNGTQAQWAQIEKGEYWNEGVPATVVHCTDGDVSLS